ncbi:hypothetical protein KQH82_11710 [bacterium]|nr:hypothetical protein [bacterium]
MRYEIRSIGVWTTIKVGFFINLVTGFGLGVMYSLFMVFSYSFSREMIVGQMMGLGMINPEEMFLIIPPFFAFGNAFFGTLLLVIVVLFYNLVARLMGGLELELKADTGRSVSEAPTARPSAPHVATPPSQERRSFAPPPPPPVLGGGVTRPPEPSVTGEPSMPPTAPQASPKPIDPPPLRPVIETLSPATPSPEGPETNQEPPAGEPPTGNGDDDPTVETFAWPEQVPAPPPPPIVDGPDDETAIDRPEWWKPEDSDDSGESDKPDHDEHRKNDQ